MSIAHVRYKSLGDFFAHECIADEDPRTAKLIHRLQHVKQDYELSRGEFIDICYWKSPRSIRRCERNPASAIERISREVFATPSEKLKIDLLTSLEGVSLPTASAILTLTDPQAYGVIDIRVWQLLYALQTVRKNPGGQGFTFNHWDLYLQILRPHARRLGAPVRLIELTLFKFHQEHQDGTLYRPSQT